MATFESWGLVALSLWVILDRHVRAHTLSFTHTLLLHTVVSAHCTSFKCAVQTQTIMDKCVMKTAFTHTFTFVLALVVRLVTRACSTAGSEDGPSSLLQWKHWQNILSQTKSTGQWTQFSYSSWCVYLLILFTHSLKPRWWLLFKSVQEVKQDSSANEVEMRLCFHPSLLVCLLAKYCIFGWKVAWPMDWPSWNS